MKMQIKADQIKEGGAPCGCGRSPNGRCCGWHALTEDAYRVKLSEWEFEQYKKQAQDTWGDSCTSGNGE
jgi:hypothetical protein